MFPLRSIHQIEITSRCNLRCRYCVHPTMARSKMDMEPRIFARSLAWAKEFKRRGTQGALNLAGIGESTMHPNFIDFLALARESLGPPEEQHLDLATNGLLVTDELAMAMKPFSPRVWVSLHRPEKAGPAVEALKRAGLIAGVSADASISATNWAGQVKWHVSAQRTPCPWVVGGWAIVLSDGRMTRCSFDGEAKGLLGHVDEDVTKMRTSAYSLCATCHQDVGVPMPSSAEVAA
jgi:hypothetical protein